jgi:hypothetical protein
MQENPISELAVNASAELLRISDQIFVARDLVRLIQMAASALDYEMRDPIDRVADIALDRMMEASRMIDACMEAANAN